MFRFFFFIAVVCLLPGVVSGVSYDVYLLAGQSNMDGRGKVEKLTREESKPPSGAIIFYRMPSHSSGGWKPLEAGYSVAPKYKGELPSPTFGPEIGFAGAMAKARPDRPMALIKASKGGTNLRVDWNPGKADEPESQGAIYRNFIEAYREATAALTARGDEFQVRGLLWHQGESDSKVKPEVHERRLRNFLERVREDLELPELPMVFGEVFDNGKRDAVRAALRAVGESANGCGFVSADGLETNGDGTHFDAASQLVLGRRFAEVLCALALDETLPPLDDGGVPKNFEELWAGFDPRAEPLDVEVLKEWEEDGVVMRVLRYQIGVFKGKRAMMAGVYGFPKGGKNLPGLLQIHGGGQYADHRAVLTNAKRGYATLSISWAGRISAPGYGVGPGEVKLFWEGATEDPSYKLTTDWGALDGYHAPSRNPKNVFPKIIQGDEWTLDAGFSPRNNSWFLCALGARRGLTFLEGQAEVDGDRLGVYGHSMGGKLTVLTTGADDRVKAAAPSCGGVSDRSNDDPLFRATIGDDVYLRRIHVPIVFLSPANDFHGRINDLQTALTEIGSEDWRVTCAPHHNHQDTAEYEVATQLWFDEHLKDSFEWPETPGVEFVDGAFLVRPDESRSIVGVDVFFTQQSDPEAAREDVIGRFWHYAKPEKKDGVWVAELPQSSTDDLIWVYANVVYALDEPVRGAGYYYGSYTAKEFNVSSKMMVVNPDAEVELRPSRLIESFDGDWEMEWFSYKSEGWARTTRKVGHPLWVGPEGAELVFEVRADVVNKLVVGIDRYAAEVQVGGGDGWQEVVLSPNSFIDARGDRLKSWARIRELRLGDQETLRARKPDQVRRAGGKWGGAPPAFRNLRWR